MKRYSLKTILCTLLTFIIFASVLNGQTDPRQRVAVIGAGAAGLTAALTLSDMGYRDVTVFEASDQAGGKIHSVSVDGRVYEMGAVFVLPDAQTIFELADRFQIPYADSGLRHTVLDQSGTLHEMMDFPQKAFGLNSLFQSLLRFDLFKFFNPKAFKDDFANAPRNLNVDFAQFAKRHGMESLALSAAPMIVGCGYGYYDEVPALYLMQLLDSFVPMFRKAMILPNLLSMPHFVGILPQGYQLLWQEIARHLNVRFNAPVTKVTRSRGDNGDVQIRVTAGNSTERFDRLVIAAPLDKALTYLDASTEEQDLFTRIQYYPYTVTLFRGRALEPPAITFLDAHTTAPSLGRVTGLYNQFSDRDVWTAGQLGAWDTSDSAMTENLREDIAAMGGSVDEIVARRVWAHFPHVKTKDLDAGFYPRLEALQGSLGTYYTGGIMNFDSVEHTARFTQKLIKRKF